MASVDTAKKAGIDWWETDPALSSRASRNALEDENHAAAGTPQALEPATDEDRDPGPDRSARRTDSKETGQR